MTDFRKRWKAWYRQYRIMRREIRKAQQDMLLFGTGRVLVSPDIPDGIRHVPLTETYQ